MAQFTHVATHLSGLTHIGGISDLEITTIDGTQYLYSGDASDGGMNVFSLSGTSAATFQEQLGYSGARGTLGLNDITLVEVAGQAALLPGGRYDNRMAIHRLDDDGTFDGTRYLGASEDIIGGIIDTEVMQLDGKTFMVAAQHNEDGFRVFRVRDDLSLEHRRHFADDADNHIGDITAMATGQIDGRTFFFTASGFDDGVTSWWMGRYGNVKERDSDGPTTSLWVDAPTAMETAEVAGKLFVVLGASGSNSLSVMRVNPWGGLFVEDHKLDTLETRFENVQAVETVIVNDRAFVIAGGTDDGLSLFELSPDGRLHYMTSVADQLDTTLTDVAEITATASGNTLTVFAAGSDAGITQFSVDLGALGDQVTGNDLDNTLVGTANNDIMLGFDGDDSLSGGVGADRLIDGAGVDSMTGGGGADIFTFVQDARMDTVTDFETGQDRLDLTDFAMLYSIDQLSFTQRAYGVLITFGADRFRIEEEDGQLLVEDLTEDHFVF